MTSAHRRNHRESWWAFSQQWQMAREMIKQIRLIQAGWERYPDFGNFVNETGKVER